MSDNRELLSTTPNAIFSQSEDAIIDYTVNWVGRINGLTISNSDWEAENSGGLTIVNPAINGNKTAARLSGSNNKYVLTNTVTLSDGQVMQFQFSLIVKSNSDLNSDYGINCGYY